MSAVSSQQSAVSSQQSAVSSQQSAVSSQQSALTQRLSASRNSHSRLFSLKTILLTASFALVSACSGGGGGSEPAPKPDTKAPTVTKVEPASGAEIAKNQTITVTFSENVKGVNKDNVSFTKSGSSNSADLTIAGSGKTYTIKPSADLEAGASYTLMLKKAIADTAGNKLAADVSKTYTVASSSNPDPAPNPGGGGTADTTAPTISSLSPANNATIGNASSKTPSITVNFSENVSNVNTDNVKFKQGTTDLGITISGSGKTYTITPKVDLVSSKPYTLEFKAGIKDAAGNALAAVTKNYTTGDWVAPSISSISPANNATSVPVSPSIELTFSKAVTGVSTANVLLSKSNTGSSPVNLIVSGNGSSYTFKPNDNLDESTKYFIVIKAANIKDAANNPLGSANQVTSFTTTYKKTISFSAWLGSSDSKIDMLDSLPNTSELYSYGKPASNPTYNSCDINNITACSPSGKKLLLNGSTMTNTAHTLGQDAYYKLKEGSRISTNSSENTTRFSARSYLQSVWFKNKFWVIGGSSGSTIKNDVWSSPDGVKWTQEKAHKASPSAADKQFPPRGGHQVVVANIDGSQKLWLIGGTDGNKKNDVWSSTDGVNWIQVKAHKASPSVADKQFSPRYAHQVVAANIDGTEKLWLIGGEDTGRKNDVWSSTDGVSWTRVLAHSASPGTNQFSARYAHQVVVANIDGSEKLWLIGGLDNTTGEKNDVWSSTDGVSWTRVLAHSASPGTNQFSKRYEHQVVVANIGGSNKLWLIGGDSRNDVWSSSNGSVWTKVLAHSASPSANQFPVRVLHQVVVANIGGTKRLYLIAGSVYGKGQQNDVWRSADGATWRKAYLGEITRP